MLTKSIETFQKPHYQFLANAKTSLSLIPNALLVVNLRFLCSEESLENAQW